MKVWISSLVAALLASFAHADSHKMTLTSDDIEHGEFMGTAQEFAGFGCTGENRSPHLAWSGAPEGTEFYAVFVYDPDAPTGSGWWHWQIINIPAEITELEVDAGSADDDNQPEGSQTMRNDYGYQGFGGACPPAGDGAHRYQFTVFALPEKLELPEDASAALTGYMVKANALASVTLEALYKK